MRGSKTIDHAGVHTLQDNWRPPSTPTDTMLFTQYGVTDFDVQGWDGTQWVTLSSITANDHVKRTVAFAPYTTTKIRVVVKNALASLSRLTEVEAWGVPVSTTNVALASGGATATASSQYSADFPPSATIDGDEMGLNWSAGGGWADGTLDTYPDWLEVDLPASKTLDHVIVYTLQDNWQAPSPPTDTMTFTQYGIVDFRCRGGMVRSG